MKKRIALAMALILALATIFVLASCGGGNEGCNGHTYSSEYTTDANGHWYEATCGCEGEVANYGAHKDADENGKCDVCAYVTCAHTYADEWSSDENGHYHASTCACAPQKKDEAPHADENKDGICDVCKYVVCSHEYDSAWSNDEQNHWKAPTCGCEIDAINLGAHVDANKDGSCDTCEYVVCAHTYETEWSSDGAYHWYAATCGCNVVKDKAEHNGEEGDTSCPTCGASICKHTYADTLTYDETHHWYAATCGCDIVKDKTEHTWSSEWEKDGINHWHKSSCGCDVISGTEAHYDSDDEDARCDTCGQIDFASLIGNVDEYVSEERNSYSYREEEKDLVGDFRYTDYLSIKIFDNYVLIKDIYNNTKYISYCGPNDSIAFVVNVESGNHASRVLDFDDSSLISLSGVCEVAAGASVEEYLIALYNLAVGEKSSGFNYTTDEENSKYSFSFVYDEGYNYYAYAVVEFTLDEERMGVTSLTLDEKRYDRATYIEGEENTVVYTVTQTITQRFGEAFDSTDSPNPYPASKYLLDELILYKAETNENGAYVPSSEQITDGCTVTISPLYENGLRLVLGANQAQYSGFNNFSIESNGLEAGWTPYPIFMYATKGGTYEVTVSNELDSVSFTVVVEYKAPTKINSAVVVDEVKTKTNKYEIYEGLDFVIGVIANSKAESPYTKMPTVTKGDASKISFEEDGENWRVIASEAGEYEITLVSALNPIITATLSLTVLEAPSAADILNGYYELAENGMGISGSIKFTPSEEGASSGTAVLKIKVAGNPMLNEPDEIWEAAVAYAYENGEITLSLVDGDDVSQFGLTISARYELTLVRTPYPQMPEHTEEYSFEVAVEKIEIDMTSSSFKMNIVDANLFSENNAGVFVAYEKGKYVFNVPKGYGIKVDTKEKVKYQNNVSGYEFALELKEGEEVTLIPQAAEVGELTIYFHIEKENPVTDANGLGGKYTFICLSQFELTFAPSDWGATSGVLTVKDPINSKNSGSFSYTIVDGDYVFDEDVGIFITRDTIGNWLFQNASLTSSPQKFSDPTSYTPPIVEQIPYNGYKDANELGGIYTVTVDGKEYKIIIVPSSDGGSEGRVQIYNPISGEYGEAYDYAIQNYDYVIDGDAVNIYRDIDDSWLLNVEGVDGVKFSDATIVPISQVISSGTTRIEFSEGDVSKGYKVLAFTPDQTGKYTIGGANLTIKVMYENNEIDINEVELEEGRTYMVIAYANQAKAYYISVAKKASGNVGDDGGIVLPGEEV